MLAEDAEFTEHVHGLCREHATLTGLLDRVEAGSHDLFPVFEKLLRAHIDREENGLFPAAAIAFAGPEWERVAALTPGPPRGRRMRARTRRAPGSCCRPASACWPGSTPGCSSSRSPHPWAPPTCPRCTDP